MNTAEKRVDPSWVIRLLEACQKIDRLIHPQRHKFLPNFCVTCLQLYCRFCPEFKGTNHPHQHHSVLIVCKGSDEYCLHASEVSKLIDISDIHLFIINSKQVVFLQRRGSEKKGRSNKFGYACKTCGREFYKDKKFCSVQCKSESGESLELIKQEAKGKEPAEKPKSNLVENNAESSYRKRSRKGVPSRPLPYVSPLDICWCGDWSCARAKH